MADEEEKVEEETIELEDSEASPRSKKKIILVAVVILLLIGASVAGTLFFLGSDDQAGDMGENSEEIVGEEGAEGEPGAEGETTEPEEGEKSRALYYPLKPPYIVNIDARGRRRYLQAELTLSTREEDVIAAIEMHKPSLDHTINIILSGHVFEDIQTAEGKELLRLELTKSLQDLLTEEIGKPGIEQVLFSNFVMQ